MPKPSELFHGGRPAPAAGAGRRPSGVRSKGEVFHVASSSATTAYGGELRIPVHPAAGSVSSMAISYKLEPGQRSRETALTISECGLCVVQGRGRVRIGKSNHEVVVGDLAFIPVQKKFSIENTGEEPLVMLGLITPPDPTMLRLAGLWAE